MIKALSKLDVITLFVEDLPESKTFYTEVFGLEVIWEDDASAVVKMSNLIINLLRVSNAPTLVEPVPVAAPGGSRALLTIEVDDANAVCAELEAHGVKLLNGPIDRPWAGARRRSLTRRATPGRSLRSCPEDLRTSLAMARDVRSGLA